MHHNPCKIFSVLSTKMLTARFQQAFVDHYYKTFDGNRSSLGSLYQDQSYLTFEGGESQVRRRTETLPGTLLRMKA